MYVCMYVSLHFPFAPQYFPQKNTVFPAFSQRGRPKTLSFFQIFGNRMQEAQASKKAGRGNRAWDPCFATPAPRRLRLVERHPPPKKQNYVIDVGRGGVRGGVILYPLVSIRHAKQCRRTSECGQRRRGRNRHEMGLANGQKPSQKRELYLNFAGL